MSELDPTRITELSTRTIVFLIVFLPAIFLGILLWLSYHYGTWT